MLKNLPFVRLFIIFSTIQIGLLLYLLIFQSPSGLKKQYKAKNELVKRFLLTDYCLSTESRHTRHINFPEMIAPFQDFPGYLEHFPSSSFFINSNWKQTFSK